MKKAAWFAGATLAGCVAVLGGCVATDMLFGPSDAALKQVDADKDGVITPEERKDAGLPIDASPWIELGMQILIGFVPGAGLAYRAYSVAKANREQVEALIVGVERGKKKLASGDPAAKVIVAELIAAKDELLTPSNAAKLTAVVESITAPKGV